MSTTITRITLLEKFIFSGGGIFVSTFLFFRALLSLYSPTDSLFLSIPCFCAAAVVYHAISHRATKKIIDFSVEKIWWNSVFQINYIYFCSLLITQAVFKNNNSHKLMWGNTVKTSWVTSASSILVTSLIVWLREHGSQYLKNYKRLS